MAVTLARECTTPIHNADGTVRYQPGDLLGGDHPDGQQPGWKWVVVEPTDVAPAGHVLPDDAVRRVSDPHASVSVQSRPVTLGGEAGAGAKDVLGAGGPVREDKLDDTAGSRRAKQQTK